jgi:hypothetical protein
MGSQGTVTVYLSYDDSKENQATQPQRPDIEAGTLATGALTSAPQAENHTSKSGNKNVQPKKRKGYTQSLQHPGRDQKHS